MKKIYLLIFLTVCFTSTFSQKIELFADFNSEINNFAVPLISDITEAHNGVYFFELNDLGQRSKLYYADYSSGQTTLLYDFKSFVIQFQAIGSFIVAGSQNELLLINFDDQTTIALEPSMRSQYVSDSLLIYFRNSYQNVPTSYFSIDRFGDTATLQKDFEINNQQLHARLSGNRIVVSQRIDNSQFSSIGYYDADTVTAIVNDEDSISQVIEHLETDNYLYFMTRRLFGDYRLYAIEKQTLTASILAEEPNTSVFNGAAPQLLYNLGDTLFFTYADATNGAELWVSWGTKASTSITQDIAAGFSPLSYSTWATTENYLYFTDATQSVVFSCNGLGNVDTAKVDGNLVQKWAEKVVVPNSNRLFISGFDSETDGNLYVMNGAGNDNYKLIDLFRIEDISEINLAANGLFTFVGQEMAAGSASIYQTLGNQGSITKLFDVPSFHSTFITGSGPNGFVYSILDSAVFTQQGDSIAPNTIQEEAGASQALFVANLGNGNNALYTSDGVWGGTYKLFEYEAVNRGSSISYMTKYKDKLYFVVNDSIMETDGSIQSLKTLYSSGSMIHLFRDSIYFFTDTAVIVSDGEGFSRTLSSQSISVTPIINADSYALLRSFESGSENLYKLTDSLSLLKSDIRGLSAGIAKGDTILFSANDPFDNGKELFFTDGTEQNTVFFKNLSAGGQSRPRQFELVGNRVYFRASDAVGQSIFSSDFTVAGTDRAPFHTTLGTSFSFQNVNDTLLVLSNNKAYYADNNNQLTEWENPQVVYRNNTVLSTHDFPDKGFKFAYLTTMSRLDIDLFGNFFDPQKVTALALPNTSLFGSVILGNKIFGINNGFRTGPELFVMEVCDFTVDLNLQDYVCHDSEVSIEAITSPTATYSYFLKDRFFPTFEATNSSGIFSSVEDSREYYLETEDAAGCNFVNEVGSFTRPDTLQFTEVTFFPTTVGSFEVDIQWSSVDGGPYYLTLQDGSRDTVFSAQWLYTELRENIDTVRLTVTNTRGCTISETFVSEVSIEETHFQNLKIYPNPASNLLKIEGLEQDVTFKIMDLNGRLSKAGVLKRSRMNTLDLSSLSKGIYLLQLDSADSSIIKKIGIK